MEVASLNNSSAASKYSLAFFSSIKISASFFAKESLDFNNFSFSFFCLSSESSSFLLVSSSSFFFSYFSSSNLALYAECAKRTDFFISLVTRIFSGLQFTGLWNFIASFRSRKPTMVCSPNLDLSFVTALAFNKRLPGPKQGKT